jgi:hypothetical protein
VKLFKHIPLLCCYLLWHIGFGQPLEVDCVAIQLKPAYKKMVVVPAFADGQVVLSLTPYGAACGLKPEGCYLIVDPKNGKVKQRFQWKGRKLAQKAWIASQFNVHRGVIFSRNAGLIYAIDGIRLKQQNWQKQTLTIPDVVQGKDHYLTDRPGGSIFLLNDSLLAFSLNPTYPNATKAELMDSLPVFYSSYSYEDRHPLFALYRLKLTPSKNFKTERLKERQQQTISIGDSSALTLCRVIGQRSPTPQNGIYYHHRWINSCYDTQRQWLFSNSMFEPTIQVWTLEGKLLGQFGERGSHLAATDTILPVSQYKIDSILSIPDRSYDSHWIQTMPHLDSIARHSYKYAQMFYDTTNRLLIRQYFRPTAAKTPFTFWQVYEIKEGTEQGILTSLLNYEIEIPINQQVIGFNQGIIYTLGRKAKKLILYRYWVRLVR